MNKGFIYKIVCNTTKFVYYGSTVQTLKERLRSHKKNPKTGSVHKVLENNNYEMILVETIYYDDKKELLLKEREYIKNNECVNIVKNVIYINEDDRKKARSEIWKKYANSKDDEWRKKRNMQVLKSYYKKKDLNNK